jgi:hypothetical protein
VPIRKTYWELYDLLSNKTTSFSKNLRPFQKNPLKWPRISVANISVLKLEEWFLQLVKLSIVPVKLVYKSLLLLTAHLLCCVGFSKSMDIFKYIISYQSKERTCSGPEQSSNLRSNSHT